MGVVILQAMRVVEAEFLSSGTDDSAGWPAAGSPEIAFIGRSNVGKSTLLGALLQRKGLVRTSATPGRTRLINFFRCVIDVNGKRVELVLVDLPGFGYAKVKKSERETWRPFVQRYLGERPNLRAAVLLVDARRQPTREEPLFLSESELAHWLSSRGVAVLPVVTKADQLRKHEKKPAAERVRRALGAPALVLSATEGEGVDELWRRLLRLIARGA
jgi:GTP-binding protein